MTSRDQTIWAGGLIALAVGLAYANSLHGPFIFDDPSSITGNATIRHLTDWKAILRTPRFTVTAEGRPVLNLTLALNYAMGGAAVLGYHLFNLAVHLAGTLTLFGVLRRIGPKDAGVAAAIALVWGVHPLQTEAVTYVVQRAESLMGLFYWLTLYGLVRANERENSGESGRRFLVLSAAACWLGMATKEDMVSAPLIALLLDRTYLAGSFWSALRRRGAYYAALGLSWGLLAYLIWSTGGNRGGSVGFNLQIELYQYWLTQFPAIIYYLRAVVWPHPLIFEYGTFWIHHWSEFIGQALVVFSLLGATVWALVRRPAWGLAGAFFFALLAPTSLAPGTTQMIVEHRMYLPLAAVLAVLGLVGARWARRPTLVAAGLVAVLCIGLTWRRNQDYRDAIGLWQLNVRQRPDNVLAHTMLGQVLDEAGRTEEARLQFERALKLNPNFKLAQEGMHKLWTKSASSEGGGSAPLPNGVVSGQRD